MMKRFTTILLTLCMLLSVLPFAVHADAAPTNLLTADKLTPIARDAGQSCNGTFNADGSMTAANGGTNDAVFLTDRYIAKGEHVYIEATAKINNGLAWGIFFTESGKDNPFDKWYCLNIDTDWYVSRMFFINTAAGPNLPYEPQVTFMNARDGEYHTLGIEILADGTMKLYKDGIMHTHLDKANFEGATLGIMTCRANIEFKSFTIQEGAPSHTTPRPDPRKLDYSSTTNLLDESVLKYQTSDNRFTIADGKMTASRAGGDRAIMSDIFVAPGQHVYIEATAKITDGNAWGIILGETSPERPFERWICLNVDGIKSRIFAPGAHCDVATPLEHFYLAESNGQGNQVTLGLEITADGTFYMTCNGVTYEQKQTTRWEGGYVGLMTWEAGVEFTEATFNVVCDHKTTKVVGAKAATATEEGYTGDTVCADCGKVLEAGTTIPKLEPVPTGDVFAIASIVAIVSLAGVLLATKKRQSV